MSKTNVSGLYTEYLSMLEKILFWNVSPVDIEEFGTEDYKSLFKKNNDNYIYRVGFSIPDMAFFGWSVDDIKNEHENYNKIVTAYRYLLKSLAEATGFEDMDNEIWKFTFKNVNTNDMLELYKRRNAKE